MTALITNCEFIYACPKKWDELRVTGNPDQRFCGECKRTVHFCHTSDELAAAIDRKDCVAVELPTEVDSRVAVKVGQATLTYYSDGKKSQDSSD